MTLPLIALLATGDEICNGDILNTNCQEISSRLINQGMQMGLHMTCGDDVAQTEMCIDFLLKHHSALIITGGLGPTSDDLTRIALSHAIKKELVFDETTWQTICTRIKNFGYQTIPENNRQQAFFPEGAHVIPNANGTAAGCKIAVGDKWIFMLPGPPYECLPMVDTVVISTLKESGFADISYRKSWMLFGVSEGQIAEALEAIVKPYDCRTGYRITYPYIEFKIFSKKENDFQSACKKIEEYVAPFLISSGKEIASHALLKKCSELNFTLQICDLATGGSLETTLKNPATYSHLSFVAENNISSSSPSVIIHGLQDYWQKSNNIETDLILFFKTPTLSYTVKKRIPLRGNRVKLYAIEIISYLIQQFIKQLETA